MDVQTTIASVIGIGIQFRGQQGTVARYEPLGAGMCDVLFSGDDGREVWVASHECKRLDGSALPSRRSLIEQADRERLRSLRMIREQHIQEFHKPWPGMEFGKAHFGQMIDAVLGDIDG
jgi:hypothetical protein